jgi:MFS family permease
MGSTNTLAHAPAVAGSSERAKNRRVVAASMTGTLIEFYDFQIYTVAAALVFPHILFPALGSTAATLASVATFGVAFVARPFGSILFGHFGDRLGRKKSLIITLMMMGIATVLVGAIPTADRIGVAAPIIVIVLRIVQGIAAGGEWAGANLFVGEHAPRGRRGLWAMVPQLGATAGFTLMSLTFMVTNLAMDTESFLAWGWRVPFLASAILVVIGLWIRISVEETPVFKAGASRTGVARFPFVEAVKGQPREILLAAGAATTNFLLFVLWSLIITEYAVNTMHISRTVVLGTNVCFGIGIAVAIVIGGKLSDRVGRRPVLIWSAAAAAAWMVVIFPLMNSSDSLVVYVLALIITATLCGLSYGPLGAFVLELFKTRYRYTASGIAYNLAAMIAGTTVPLVGTAVMDWLGPSALGVLLSALLAIAALCAFLCRETRDTDLNSV